MDILKDIEKHLKQTNSVEKLIYSIVFFFVISILFESMATNWFALFGKQQIVLSRPWTLISYAFVHFRLFHAVSNIIILYYVGNLFLNFFSSKKLLIYYFLGVFVGGLLFVMYTSIAVKINSPLVGASAGVTAILVGLATKIPHYALRLRFIGSVELWVLTAIWIGLSVLGTAGVNAGGAVAHLGGALIGYLLTAYLNEGNAFVNYFTKKEKSPFNTVYTNTEKPKTQQSHRAKKQHQRKIDAILDKISKAGYDALSKAEKDFLFSQKKDN